MLYTFQRTHQCQLLPDACDKLVKSLEPCREKVNAWTTTKPSKKKKSMFTFKYKERTLETITHAFLEEVQEH